MSDDNNKKDENNSKKGLTTYSTIDDTVKTLLSDYKNGEIDDKQISISLERMYKNEFTSFGSKRVYARYGITKTGKILIDFKRNGRPISLSLSECEKLNNILSSRNFEKYINTKKDLIETRNKEFFDNLKKTQQGTNVIDNRMNMSVDDCPCEDENKDNDIVELNNENNEEVQQM